jgi:deoxyribonuclease-4
VIHVNDSKAALGSRVDRHEHVGKGKIGLEAFRRILNHTLLSSCAFILETPIDRPGDDKRNVAALWKLVGRTVKARGIRDGMKPRRRSRARAKYARQR